MKTSSKIVFGSLEYQIIAKINLSCGNNSPNHSALQQQSLFLLHVSVHCGLTGALLYILFILGLRLKEQPLSGTQQREKRNGGAIQWLLKLLQGSGTCHFYSHSNDHSKPDINEWEVYSHRERPCREGNIFEQILSTAMGQNAMRKPQSSCRVLVGS